MRWKEETYLEHGSLHQVGWKHAPVKKIFHFLKHLNC